MKTFVKNLQTLTGATRQELLVVATLLAGLALGALIRLVGATPERAGGDSPEIARLLDSLAAAETATFAGVAPDGAPARAEGLAEKDSASAAYNSESHLSESRSVARRDKISSGAININSATKQELMRLPGVGEKTAEKILEFRAAEPFRRPEDIMRVKGVGVKKFAAMRQFLRVR